MQERLIMQELSKKIKADKGGNCPFDPGCAYGYGKTCSADDSVLKKKFEEIMNEPDTDQDFTPGLFMEGDTEETWPCNNCIRIKFVQPGK